MGNVTAKQSPMSSRSTPLITRMLSMLLLTTFGVRIASAWNVPARASPAVMLAFRPLSETQEKLTLHTTFDSTAKSHTQPAFELPKRDSSCGGCQVCTCGKKPSRARASLSMKIVDDSADELDDLPAWEHEQV